ncbi:tyrosine-type recombinase/integrase [Flavobacterium sp. TP390]|uniref:Tyrosine-type recombinase/integrase n=1 Tax=Flavobacterium profundi TaxID=1774945 RepID=A0A6I4IJM5_9FLAO|nr:site-specific integrase [Flavobacterium profundi]MVO09784.1 tyrosine-type recombinase/integrase [Flavobacterium profundi]
MATIKFLIQTKNNPANIYVRLIDGRKVDVKTKTNFIINPSEWSAAKQRPKNLKNAEFKNLDFELQELKTKLLNYYNNNLDQEINLQWLKNFFNPQEESIVPTSLIDYFNFYLEERKNDISHRQVLKINVVKNKLIKIEKEYKKKYLVKDINIKFKNEFENYNLTNGYSKNTIANNLKVIKSICKHAKKRGLTISNELEEIRTTERKAISVYLTFEELEKIENLKIGIQEQEEARDWLLISCYTGQRISDFMRFKKEMVITHSGKQLIEFSQQKTGKKMVLPLHPKVTAILKKRNGNFPKKTTDPKYNVLIKIVCKKAGITDLVFGGKNDPDTNRKVFKEYEKHELVTSHIGRRSFATNFYGTIPTSLLISATGHSTEKMFLTYIGKSSSDQALELANYF